jgi:tetratricopeptide (TPR) repeat protein
MWHAFPMTRLVGVYSFALNYHFDQLHPTGYHIFNFIVHLLTAGMVWALADLLFKITQWLPSKDCVIKEFPFIIAVLFLVHPCQTQAVTYITQRFESMATLFYLGTIYLYLRARLSAGGSRILFFGLAGFLTILGILTKEVIITVPAMILACEWILFPTKDNKKFYIALIAGGVLFYLLFTKLVHANLSIFLNSVHSESHDGDILTPVRYLLTQMRVFLTFLRILVFPIHQQLDYDYPASTGLLNPPLTLLGLSVILGFVFLIIKLRRSFPLIAFGLAWVLITFSINLAPRSNVIFEHKLYLISFGFFLAAVTALSVLVKNRGTLLKILWCMIVILGIVAFERNKVWANELALWEDNIKMSPDKARVNASLGRMYGSLGRYDEAIHYLSRSIAITPDNITYENRGIIYSFQGRMTQALEDLNKSIGMDPGYPTTYVKRAWVYYQLHNYKAAMADLNIAIQLEPYFLDAYIERGMIWAAIGNNEGALKDFQQALKINPLDYQVLLKLGYLYYAEGHYDLALEDFTKAQALEPTSTEAAQYRSNCLIKLGRPPPNSLKTIKHYN